MTAPLILWHGAHRWEGPPRIVTSRKGKVEHGPGIYLTTSAATARSYAKGGGSVIRFEVARPLVWEDDVRIAEEVLLDFVKHRERVKNRAKIIADIRDNADRAEAAGRGRFAIASVLANLFAYYGALTGEHGPALAAFYVAAGIDAAHVRQGNEDWIVLYNLDKILSYKKVPYGDATDSLRIERAHGRSMGVGYRDATRALPAADAPGTRIDDIATFLKLVKPRRGMRPGITLGDGTALSVQANDGAYCKPRVNNAERYTEVEVDASPKLPELEEYADGDTVYGYVPVGVLDAVVRKHGGIRTIAV